VKSVTMHGSNTPVKFEQDDFRIRLIGLPKRAPELVTTFALECDGEPRQSHEGKRAEKPRDVTA
jgi:hypothetical protein